MPEEVQSRTEGGKGSIPPSIADKLNALCIDKRSPAFLQVDEAGTVVGEGGDCARYGFGSLRPDSPVGHQLDYLEGILPLEGGSPLSSSRPCCTRRLRGHPPVSRSCGGLGAVSGRNPGCPPGIQGTSEHK